MQAKRRSILSLAGALLLGLSFQLFAVESGSTVEVELSYSDSIHDGTPVFLGVGDTLTASVDGEVYELEPAPDAAQTDPTYVAQIPVSRGGAWIQVSLEREHGEPARYSGVTLPADFDLSEPEEGALRSRSLDSLVVRYGSGSQSDIFDPMGRTMNLEVVGDCFAPQVFDGRPDLGWFELAEGTLEGSGTCEAALAVERTGSEGAFDPNLAGGTASARQIRSVVFWSMD